MADGNRPIKDSAGEHPIPSQWRPVFGSIVHCLVAGDFRLRGAAGGVAPLTPEQAEYLEAAISHYGNVTLIELPDETWTSSVAQWRGGDSWDTLVDLFTAEEGCSDLVLATRVTETNADPRFDVEMIYVP